MPACLRGCVSGCPSTAQHHCCRFLAVVTATAHQGAGARAELYLPGLAAGVPAMFQMAEELSNQGVPIGEYHTATEQLLTACVTVCWPGGACQSVAPTLARHGRAGELYRSRSWQVSCTRAAAVWLTAIWYFVTVVSLCRCCSLQETPGS